MYDFILSSDTTVQKTLTISSTKKEMLDITKKMAEAGNREAQFNLAYLYFIGVIGQDNAQAKKWFVQAARQGHRKAEQYLSFMMKGCPIKDTACDEELS